MRAVQVDHEGGSRLRFVFHDAVFSFSLAANSTFEDIARTLNELEPQRHGNPVAIDLILGSAGVILQRIPATRQRARECHVGLARLARRSEIELALDDGRMVADEKGAIQVDATIIAQGAGH